MTTSADSGQLSSVEVYLSVSTLFAIAEDIRVQ